MDFNKFLLGRQFLSWALHYLITFSDNSSRFCFIINLTTAFFSDGEHASMNAAPQPQQKIVIGPDQIYFRAFWER